MQRSIAITVALVLALAIGLTTGDWGMDRKQAVQIAGAAATQLGFDLTKLPPPEVSGSSLWGTKSFHWASSKGDTIHRLSYLVLDEALCWSSAAGRSSQDHGCVVVKLP